MNTLTPHGRFGTFLTDHHCSSDAAFSMKLLRHRRDSLRPLNSEVYTESQVSELGPASQPSFMARACIAEAAGVITLAADHSVFTPSTTAPTWPRTGDGEEPVAVAGVKADLCLNWPALGTVREG